MTNAQNIFIGDGYVVFTIDSAIYGEQQFLIDIDDMPIILKRRWTVYQPANNHHLYLKSKDGDLHRIIAGAAGLPRCITVNHINLDTHDNRRCNLETGTPRQNTMNRKDSREFRCVEKRGKSYDLNIYIFGKSYKFTFKTLAHAVYTHQRLIVALGSRPNQPVMVDIHDYEMELERLLARKRTNASAHILASLKAFHQDKEGLRHELSKLAAMQLV